MMKCKYCDKVVRKDKFIRHLKSEHRNEYKEQVQLIKELFFDYNFGENTLDQYPQVVISINAVYTIWKQFYTSEERKERGYKCCNAHILNAFNKCSNMSNNINILNEQCIKSFKDIISLDSKHMHTNKYCAIQGFRPDIGHAARLTYEANIYRIFQYENKKYKYEMDNVFSITFPDGSVHKYIIDICDIEGLFAESGTYIEIKGYMDEKSIIKINSFREQYPQYKLITIGKQEKYKNSYIYDIDYNKLEQKYKKLIPLWETRVDNIRINAQKWNINTDINYISNYSAEQIAIIKQLFYDKNFTRANSQKYKNKINNIHYHSIYNE